MRTPFTVDDLYLHHKASNIVISPDGAHIACTFRSVDKAEDSYRHALWTMPLDGGAPQQIDQGGGNADTSPRWSPDGKTLGFLSIRSGSVQVHTITQVDGQLSANVQQVGNVAGGVSDFAWSADGTWMVFNTGMTVDPGLRGKRAADVTGRKTSAVEVAWKLPYKADGVGYLLGREMRMFRLDVGTGEHVELSNGACDVLGFDVSPDSRQIAYSRTRAGRFAHCTELWICDAMGQQHRPLAQHQATVATPVWSPDGKWIAFTGAAVEGAGPITLWLYELASNQVSEFKPGIEVAAATAPHWSADGQHLIFNQALRGRHQLVIASLQNRSIEVLAAGDRQFGAFAVHDDKLVYSVDSPVLPSEVWLASVREAGERQLTDMNPWWRERTELKAEMRSFDVPDGSGGIESIEGWLLRAADADAAGPLLNDMHGGPAAYALLDFDSNVFWQALCCQGWSVLALNAVGSSSYGSEFAERLTGQWGKLDLPQHLAAIESLQQEGICDDRLAVSGKSYGGFLSAWTIGHTSTFKAAVVMAPVGNIEAHYGTSDGGYYADPFYLGTAPAFDRDKARSNSPVQYVEQSTTPTLFMHGKDDERCPRSQSEELFVGMMRAGETPTELVLYPGEGHGFLGQGKPACRADAAARIIDWVQAHVCKDEMQ
ncbi:MAG: S9 family peptidase [Janthinobacterium lividum]